MRIALRILLSVPWLLLLYCIGASAFIAFFGNPGMGGSEGTSSTSMVVPFIAVSLAGVVIGCGCVALRWFLYWKNRSLTVDRAGGAAVYFMLSFLIQFFGYVSLAGLLVLFFLNGSRGHGIAGVLIALPFLVLGFPFLPRRLLAKDSTPQPMS